ncbi:MAG: hypothetical protein QNJ16_04830 [Rhodobacter sp.]|nr:hypothetical protein [Rhodobacter sp.]
MLRFLNALRPVADRAAREYRRSASVVSFNHDGLEIARIKTERRWLPVWHILVFAYLVLLIRLIAVVDIGPAGYAVRMEAMQNGSVLERAAAKVMTMDPMSRQIAIKIRGGLDAIF